jgi:farnesyl-diphosphate farnesyltransferase
MSATIAKEAGAEASVEIWSGKDRGDENFPVGGIVRPALRPHVHAFYAFARNADDISDSSVLSADEKVRRLHVMEDVLLGRRDSGSPSATRLRASLAETGITPVHSCELLIAFRRDATKLRYENWEELADYCRYSASPVGRHVLDLHGESRDTWEPSDALCTSLQVLNHLQDGSKDLKNLDRCYLPNDLLRAAGGAVEDLHGRAQTPGLRQVIDQLLDHCDELNAAAIGLPQRTKDRRLRLETAVIVGLAKRLTARLRVGDPVATRVKLQKSDVLAAVLSALRFL